MGTGQWSNGAYPNADLEATMPTLDALASFRMAGSYEMLSSAKGLGLCEANHAYASTASRSRIRPCIQLKFYGIRLLFRQSAGAKTKVRDPTFIFVGSV